MIALFNPFCRDCTIRHSVYVPSLGLQEIVINECQKAILTHTLHCDVCLQAAILTHILHCNVCLQVAILTHTLHCDVCLQAAILTHILHCNVCLQVAILTHTLHCDVCLQVAILTHTLHCDVCLQAAILTHTTNYISHMLAENSRLQTQNQHYRRMLNRLGVGLPDADLDPPAHSSPIPKRIKRDTGQSWLHIDRLVSMRTVSVTGI